MSGFSLIELAVALTVLGFLIGSLIVPFGAWNDARARRDTDKALADIREALVGYAIANGRLPCPAAGSAMSGAAGNGTEARAGDSCRCVAGSAVASVGGTACATVAVGVLPWVTLGLPETDAWGRRYTYGMDAQFGRDPGQTTLACAPNPPPAFASFALCSPTRIEVRTAANGALAVSAGVPAIVVSHGRNGAGAYTPQGSILALAGAGEDEQENADGDAGFVSNTNIDDQIVWLPSHILMNRMLAAGRLP